MFQRRFGACGARGGSILTIGRCQSGACYRPVGELYSCHRHGGTQAGRILVFMSSCLFLRLLIVCPLMYHGWMARRGMIFF